MSEQIGYVYARRTRSGKGIRFRDNEIVYVASIRSIERFLKGEVERVRFAKFPYRYSEDEEVKPNTVYTYCQKCERNRIFRKVGEDTWRCEVCRTEKKTHELLGVLRSIIDEGR